jgi:uncharacterized membrane protein YfcA
VATKSACLLLTHLAKLLYFGALVGAGADILTDPLVMTIALATAIAGTTVARPFLQKLSDATFRRVTTWLVMGVGASYLIRGIIGYL